MEKKLIVSGKQLDITISRLASQILEHHHDIPNTVLIGLQPRGKFFAKRIQQRLEKLGGVQFPLGILDATFHRDDFRRRAMPAEPNATDIPFLLEDKKAILIDDVLYTGRSIRAAMDAMLSFGRPQRVELMVLIERRYSREFPIDPNYVGRQVNSLSQQRVKVEYTEQGFEQDSVWLITEASE